MLNAANPTKENPMRIWALISQKGGGGRTTLSLHLATHAHTMGIKTAIIDADPQQSAERWAVIRDTDEGPRVIPSIVPDLVRLLPRLVADQFELVIIDTAPRANRDLVDVAAKADLIIMPCRPSILDLPAVEDTLSLVRSVRRGKRAVVVLNSVPARTAEGDEAASILAKMGVLLPQRLGERVEFRRALTAGLGITEFSPKSVAAQELKALFNELWRRHDDDQ